MEHKQRVVARMKRSRTWREAAALCSKSDDFHLHSRLARIAVEMVRLGDAGGAMNALKSHTGPRTSELVPPTRGALLKTLELLGNPNRANPNRRAASALPLFGNPRRKR